jgi:RNA polymerase sigma-70 factor (ECF subfamily)
LELFRAVKRIIDGGQKARKVSFSVSVTQEAMTLSTIPSDDELLRRMLAGDEEAFAQLYQRRQGGIYRFALRMSGSEALAEDVTQEVFLALMKEACHFDAARGPLSSYLFGIARNQVLRRLERDRFYAPLLEESENGDGPQPELLAAPGDPLGDLTRSETIEAVRQAVLALPAHYREVVVLCDLHEMSYTEVAAALSCAVGTVRSRLYRARALLVQKLRAQRAADRMSSARCFA